MYKIDVFKQIFFSVLFIIFLIILVLALFRDIYTQNQMKYDILLKKEELLIELLEKSRKNNEDIYNVINEENELESKIRNLIDFHESNESLTKKIVNESIGGFIRGSIFGYIVDGYKGALVTMVLFAVLDPISFYITNRISLNDKIL